MTDINVSEYSEQSEELEYQSEDKKRKFGVEIQKIINEVMNNDNK